MNHWKLLFAGNDGWRCCYRNWNKPDYYYSVQSEPKLRPVLLSNRTATKYKYEVVGLARLSVQQFSYPGLRGCVTGQDIAAALYDCLLLHWGAGPSGEQCKGKPERKTVGVAQLHHG